MAGGELIHKIHALWRVPVILIVTAFLSTLSVFFSFIDNTGRLQHRCARLWARFIFFVSGVQVDIEGLQRLRSGRGYVFVAYHLSMFDHWAFLSYVPFQIRFAAKASLFKIPFLGWHLRRSGNLPVHYRNPRQTLRSFEQVADRIRSGMSFVIYPEGMRTLDGVTVSFKRGAFLLPRHARAPIVPVTLINAQHRLQRGSIIIRSGRMGMIIHDPIEFDDYKEMDLQELANQVRGIILSRYDTP